MSSPLSVAAGLLGRVFCSVPCALMGGSASLAIPVAMVATAGQEVGAQEWIFAGFQSESRSPFVQYTPPAITVPDLRLYADVLGIDETQQEILRDMYDEFVRSHNREWTLYAEARHDEQSSGRMRHGMDRQSPEMIEIINRYEATKERLESAFLSDLRLLLSASQSERWPDFEREHRRLKTLSAYAAHPEEGIDLVASVGALDLDEPTRENLRPLLDEYRMQIDATLVPRNSRARKLGEELQELQRQQEEVLHSSDPMTSGERWNEIRERQKQLVPAALELHGLCARLRDIKLHYQARIEEQLPPNSLDAFRELTVIEERSPVQHMFRAERMFTWLGQMRSNLGSMRDYTMNGVRFDVQPLTDEQKQQIDRIREEFDAKREALLDRHLPAGWKQENRNSIHLSTPQGQISLVRRPDEQPSGNAVRFSNGVAISEELQSGISRIDQEAIDRLREILTIEQRQLLVQR